MCDAASPRQIELCAVMPDSLWHFGTRTKEGEINSRSALSRYEKKNHIVTMSGQSDMDAMKKEAEKGRADLAAKSKKDRMDALSEAITGTGVVNSDGEISLK